ncbi:MAG: hypothetical protein IJT07_01450 [Oscillospiraceae bacterium]|nr:hypothetical protein [Oscillospiraceae bacterium]
MKKYAPFIRLLLGALLVCALASAACAANANSASALTAALSGGDATVTLTADITYNAPLTVPEGKTLNLNGKNLYVTGLTNNGTITKNGGKLWADVSTAATLTAAPTTADLSNLWAANEELLDPYTDLDGIRFTAALEATGKAVSTAIEREKSYTPRMYAAGAYTSNAALYYANVRIPSGKTLDLNGHNISLRAIGTSFGEGVITPNGNISLWFYGISNAVPNLENALALAKERSGIVTNLHHTNNNLTCTDAYPIPNGITLTHNGTWSLSGTVVFDYTDDADKARTGSDQATSFVKVVTDKASLIAALQSETTVTLGNNIEYGAALTIPEGKTLNLNGYNLYVKNLTNNGSLKNDIGGRLWLDVNSVTALTAAPTSSDLSTLWAAVEELNSSKTDFGGIRLTANIEAKDYVYNGSDMAATTAWQKKNLPNMYAAEAFSSTVRYGIVKIPSDKMLDLNGYTLTLRAIKPTLGAGTILANGGRIVLWYNATSGQAATLASAVALANERPGIVSALYHTTQSITYTSYPIPSGVTLTINPPTGTKPAAADGDITFLVANQSDFTRTGAKLAAKFKLTRNLTLNENLDLGNKDFSFNGHVISGSGRIKTSGKIVYNGGGYVATVFDETQLRSALTESHIALIRLGQSITLSDDIDLGTINFDFGSYELNGGTIKTTGAVYSSGGGTMRTAFTATEFWTYLNEMQNGNSKIVTLRLGADLDLTGSQTSSTYPNLSYAGTASSAYFKISVPAGKKLDLVGHTIKYRPVNSNLGEIDTAYAGRFVLQNVGPNSSSTTSTNPYGRWSDAVALTNNYPGLVTEFVLGATVGSASTNVSVPAGVYVSGKTIKASTLTFKTGATTALTHSASTVVYECANAADFTRLGFTSANTLRLSADIQDDELTVRVRKGQTLDLNGHTLFCAAVTLDEGATLQENGGALRRTATASTAAELEAALQIYTDVTLTADISAPNTAFSVPLRATLDLGGHNLTCKKLSAPVGSVFDSADGKGKLTADTCSIIDLESNYVPLCDGESYRFFRVESNLRRAPETLENGALRFTFRYRFSNADAYDLIAGSNSGLKFFVNLVSDGKTAARFVYSDTLTQTYAERTAQGENVILRFDLIGTSRLGGEVYTDAYLANDALIVESHATEADAAQRRYFETKEETDILTKTVKEIKAVDEDILREAIVRTAFAYYDKNPYTQYGMTNDNGYVKNLYTGVNDEYTVNGGKQYKTKITQGGNDYYFFALDNGQFTNLVATRAQYGHRRPFGLSPEQVWSDNLYISQCSGFPYFVYYNTFRNTDGSPYEIYGGHLTYNGGWTGNGSDYRTDMTVLAWCDLNNSASTSYAPYGSENDFATELGKVKTMQAGDILHTEGHIMLCIGDYDNDGYIELIHSWPVEGDIDTHDSDERGNLTPSNVYHLTSSGTINTTPYRVSGEHHETSGCLEIIYWQETKWDADGNPLEGRLMIDTPLSGKVSEEQTRITVNASHPYLYAVRPLMATETDTKYDVALCMDDLTLTPDAQTRLRYDRLSVDKWLADESGENMIYATHTLLPGQTLTVRLQLTNNSAHGYNVPFVQEELPEGVTLVDGELRHENIAIRAGETVDLSYKVRVNDDLSGGMTLTFPKGSVLGLDTREITIRISDEVADAKTLTAIRSTSDLPASIQSLSGKDLDFANQFYSAVLGKKIALPKTVANWVKMRMTTRYCRGQIAGVKDQIVETYVPLADIADEGNPSLTLAQKTSLKLAKLELPRTLIGRFLTLKTDQFEIDDKLTTQDKTVYVTQKLDVFNRLFEVGWDEYYLPGDVFLVAKLDNPVYPQATTLDTGVDNVEIYIYLGNNLCVKHTATGTTVESFDDTVGQCAWEGLFVALRPLTMK